MRASINCNIVHRRNDLQREWAREREREKANKSKVFSTRHKSLVFLFLLWSFSLTTLKNNPFILQWILLRRANGHEMHCNYKTQYDITGWCTHTKHIWIITIFVHNLYIIHVISFSFYLVSSVYPCILHVELHCARTFCTCFRIFSVTVFVFCVVSFFIVWNCVRLMLVRTYGFF